MIKNLKKLFLGSESGQALILSMVVSSIVAGAAYYMLGTNPSARVIKLDNVRNSEDMIKENAMALLDNDAAWFQTVNRNPNLACLRNPGSVCTPANFGPINVYDGDGTLFLGTLANSGFDYSGSPCTTFSAANPDLSCVFKYEVTWSCNGPCGTTTFLGSMPVASSPRIHLVSTFAFASKDKDLMVKTKGNGLGFDFIRGSKGKTLSQYCNSIDGVFDQRSGVCNSAMSKPRTFNCADINSHSWFVGFRKDGTPICKTDVKLGQNCPSGTAVIGYQEDGRILCGPF